MSEENAVRISWTEKHEMIVDLNDFGGNIEKAIEWAQSLDPQTTRVTKYLEPIHEATIHRHVLRERRYC